MTKSSPIVALLLIVVSGLFIDILQDNDFMWLAIHLLHNYGFKKFTLLTESEDGRHMITV